MFGFSRETCVTGCDAVQSQQHRFATQRKDQVFVPTLGSTTTAGGILPRSKPESRHTRSKRSDCKSAASGQTSENPGNDAVWQGSSTSSGAINHRDMTCKPKSRHIHTYATHMLLRILRSRYAYVCTHTRHQKLYHFLFFVSEKDY